MQQLTPTHNPTIQAVGAIARVFARRFARLFALASTTALFGCGSPFAGGWSGTMDVGPFLAHAVTVQMPPEGLEGDVRVTQPRQPGFDEQEAKVFRICKGTATGEAFELQIDLKNPDCAGKADGPTDIHTFKGTLGVGVMFGEVHRGERRIGFFRAFRDKPIEPAS